MKGYHAYNDEELLDLMKADDQGAFSEIYNRHWKFLYKAAYYAVKRKEDCMDVCQTVFLWLWENRKTIKVKSNLQSYLYTAVKYKIANLIRQGKIREILIEDMLAHDLQADEISLVEIKELKSFIAQLIDDLPEKCREVFLLSRDEHLSHRQISERLGISEKTVDDHITRALKKLRAPLGRLACIFLTI
ncbi:RNA polymerase sigma factor [Pedobacter insulae]|uniref:RNA polymerase sigma-70 factor, ECF subfamily n=1 Tax=Pedobacter insulae TaxID=414048 RepID=A0A1I3AMB0_9SPHI|nr:RNA polymerase sigma-70 factor [Pedobacter insulae]SFH51197.1 RNA polymerase sigma-70 factor, ECF subfamily [Pedobacter insulae]